MKARAEDRGILFLFLLLLWSIVFYMALQTAAVPVGVFFDSETYLFSGLSPSGDSLRPWPSVMLFRLFDSPRAASFAQFGTYGLAWSVVLAALSPLRPLRYQFAILSLLVCLASTPFFVRWNLAILSEALTMTLLIGAFGLAISALRLTSVNYRAGLLILGLALVSIAAVNRLPAIILIGPFVILLVWESLRASWSARLKILTVAVVGILLAYPLWFNSNTDQWWSQNLAVGPAKWFPKANSRDPSPYGPTQGLTRSALNFVYLSSSGSGSANGVFADKLSESVAEEAGSCIEALRADWNAIDGGAGLSPAMSVFLIPKYCPSETLWLNERVPRHYLGFLLSHPIDTLRQSVWSLGVAGGGPSGPGRWEQIQTFLPPAIFQLFETTSASNSISSPIFLWLGLAFVSVIVMLWRGKKRVSQLWIVSGVFALFSLLSVLASNLVQVADLPRTAAPIVVPLYASVVVLILETLRLLGNDGSEIKESE